MGNVEDEYEWPRVACQRGRERPGPVRTMQTGPGKGYQLNVKPSFSQRGRFACTGFRRPKFELATSSDCT